MVSGNLKGAIILASGMEKETISTHFSPDEEGTLLEYVLDSVWTVADELNVVFLKEPDVSVIESISPFGARIITAQNGENALSAIFSAFKSSRAEHCLLVNERVPLLKPNVVLALYDAAQGYDLSIPKWENGNIEPMLAVYRGKALLRLVSSLKTSFKDDVDSEMKSLADQLFDVNYVSVEGKLKELDPELDSFMKVNDGKSLALARTKSSIRGSKPKKSD
jgi:molybdopterin-guanine dinucleotide biosynthesis protein A